MNICKYLKFRQGLLEILNFSLKKKSIELNFWRDEIERCITWYRVRIDHFCGIPSLASQEKIVAFSLRE